MSLLLVYKDSNTDGYVPNNLHLPQDGQFSLANEGHSLLTARSFGAETEGGRIRLPQT